MIYLIFLYLKNFFFFNFFFFFNLKIGVSSNLSYFVSEIQFLFENKSFLKIKQIQGSSGYLCTQIINGLNIDCFFSADKKRPLVLLKKNFLHKDFLYNYAYGTLIFWSVINFINFSDFKKFIVLFDKSYDKFKLVVPNFDLSPYGKLASFLLKKNDTFNIRKKNLIFGENVNHTFLYINSKNVNYGFSSFSQILQHNRSDFKNFVYIFPFFFQKKLNQTFCILKTKKFLLSRCLFDFNKSYLVIKIIYCFGYAKNNNFIYINNFY